MKGFTIILFTAFYALVTSFHPIEDRIYSIDESRIISYEFNPKAQELRLYWKNDLGSNYLNFENLRTHLKKKNKDLIFAMNGGMYLKDHSPQGLYIENGITKKTINTTKEAYGNFYMQPNGIFYIADQNIASVCQTTEFKISGDIQYATQSGPMLMINGEMHPQFIKGSNNLHIRNGVGILPNGNILFAMSKELINFYDFATFFEQKGCKNALYLDGFVSRMYLPSKNWEQLDGNFGVIIGITE